MSKKIIRDIVLGQLSVNIGLRSLFYPEIHPSAEILKSRLDRLTKIGRNVRIVESIIGPGCEFGDEVDAENLFVSRNLSVGRNTVFARGGSRIIVSNGNRCDIGSFCSIAEGLRLISIGHNYELPSTYYFRKRVMRQKIDESISRGSTVIGSDVWIGSGVFINGGIEIGHGAVIGAMSVVTQDVPPYAIVVGNPARVLKLRFEISLVNRLLELAWWDLPYEILKTKAAERFFTVKMTSESLKVFELYVSQMKMI